MAIGVPYETFWSLNPKTLKPFFEAYQIRSKREAELKGSEIDISAWSVGLYVRNAIVSAFEKSVQYPQKPISIQKREEDAMTGKDHADRFRQFLNRYKRPPVAKKGGESHGD